MLLLGENWFGGSNGYSLSVAVSLVSRSLPHVFHILPTDALIRGGGGILRDFNSGGPFGGFEAGGANGLCRTCNRESGRGDTAMSQRHSRDEYTIK